MKGLVIPGSSPGGPTNFILDRAPKKFRGKKVPGECAVLANDVFTYFSYISIIDVNTVR